MGPEQSCANRGQRLVLGLWLWLYRPVFQYLGIIFSRNDFRTNQVMLVGVVVLIVWQLRSQGVGVTFGAAPRLFVPGLALALVGGMTIVLVMGVLDRAHFAGGLGLWLAEPGTWREELPRFANLWAMVAGAMVAPALLIHLPGLASSQDRKTVEASS